MPVMHRPALLKPARLSLCKGVNNIGAVREELPMRKPLAIRLGIPEPLYPQLKLPVAAPSAHDRLHGVVEFPIPVNHRWGCTARPCQARRVAMAWLPA